MASAYIARRELADGRVAWRVLYRLGGRDTVLRAAGSFSTQREAKIRRDWVAGELAAMRVPDLRFVAPSEAETLETAAERWRLSRVDVADGTATTHRVNLGRILPTLGTRPIDTITPADVADLIADLHAGGLKRETIRKTRATLAMVLDHAGVQPNPARDRAVKLPREDRDEIQPPTAAHVRAVFATVAARYRLPLLVLDGTGMRVSELEGLTWGDVDEYEGRWRVTSTVSKTSRARWVPVPADLFEHVTAAVPREDRTLDASPFPGVTADRLRTAIARACKATGTPLWSPHDLRHRRATLWHLAGVPAAEAAAWLGHSAQEHLRTYAHVVLDRTELDYPDMLGDARAVIHR